MTHTQEITPTHPITPLTDTQLGKLASDLHPDRVAKLDKGRTKLSYLEAWDVKATLIRIFGFGGFSAEADLCEIVRIEDNVPKTDWQVPPGGSKKEKVTLPIEFTPDGKQVFGTANFRVTVRLRVKLTIHQLGAVYAEWAAASQTGPDVGEVTDFAIKTAESDALKRAAIYLGSQFGLSLYNDGATRDVVGTVLAPGQEWSRGARFDPTKKVERPEGAAGSVSHLRGEGVSDEQHEENLANINAALSARRQQPSSDASAALDPAIK